MCSLKYMYVKNNNKTNNAQPHPRYHLIHVRHVPVRPQRVNDDCEETHYRSYPVTDTIK